MNRRPKHARAPFWEHWSIFVQIRAKAAKIGLLFSRTTTAADAAQPDRIQARSPHGSAWNIAAPLVLPIGFVAVSGIISGLVWNVGTGILVAIVETLVLLAVRLRKPGRSARTTQPEFLQTPIIDLDPSEAVSDEPEPTVVTPPTATASAAEPPATNAGRIARIRATIMAAIRRSARNTREWAANNLLASIVLVALGIAVVSATIYYGFESLTTGPDSTNEQTTTTTKSQHDGQDQDLMETLVQAQATCLTMALKQTEALEPISEDENEFRVKSWTALDYAATKAGYDGKGQIGHASVREDLVRLHFAKQLRQNVPVDAALRDWFRNYQGHTLAPPDSVTDYVQAVRSYYDPLVADTTRVLTGDRYHVLNQLVADEAAKIRIDRLGMALVVLIIGTVLFRLFAARMNWILFYVIGIAFYGGLGAWLSWIFSYPLFVAFSKVKAFRAEENPLILAAAIAAILYMVTGAGNYTGPHRAYEDDKKKKKK